MTNPRPPNQPIHFESRERAGAKLVSPSATRNSHIIGEHLDKILPSRASVLEIASGTGQHGAHMSRLRPDISWQMSDIDEASRQSQKTYIQDFPDQMPPPLSLDVCHEHWTNDLPKFDAIFCANMIHIAPWEAALGLANGVSNLLKNNGILCLYGPFLKNAGNATSNIQFDRSLKDRNPQWGVRNLTSVKHIFADAGLSDCTIIEMPRDNFLLVFR